MSMFGEAVKLASEHNEALAGCKYCGERVPADLAVYKMCGRCWNESADSYHGEDVGVSVGHIDCGFSNNRGGYIAHLKVRR